MAIICRTCDATAFSASLPPSFTLEYLYLKLGSCKTKISVNFPKKSMCRWGRYRALYANVYKFDQKRSSDANVSSFHLHVRNTTACPHAKTPNVNPFARCISDLLRLPFWNGARYRSPIFSILRSFNGIEFVFGEKQQATFVHHNAMGSIRLNEKYFRNVFLFKWEFLVNVVHSVWTAYRTRHISCSWNRFRLSKCMNVSLEMRTAYAIRRPNGRPNGQFQMYKVQQNKYGAFGVPYPSRRQ